LVLYPFDSIRAKHRDYIEFIKWFRTSMSVLSRSSCTNLSDFSKFVGFGISRWCLMIDQRFSTRLTSELFGGQSITSNTSWDKTPVMWSVLNCNLFSNRGNIIFKALTEIFLTRATVAEHRWLLLRKCKIV